MKGFDHLDMQLNTPEPDKRVEEVEIMWLEFETP
jgi:hypothetical protein